MHMSISGSCAAGCSAPLPLKALDVLMARAQPDTEAQTSASLYLGLICTQAPHTLHTCSCPLMAWRLPTLGHLWQAGRWRTKGVAINALPTEGVIRAAGQLCQLPLCKCEQPSAPLLHLLAGTTGLCVSPSPSTETSGCLVRLCAHIEIRDTSACR